jgi:hypothetical protein
MTSNEKKEKLQFYARWTALIAALTFAGAIVGFIIALIISGIFGYDQLETGPYIIQTAGYCAFVAIFATAISTTQWKLLLKEVGVSSLWIFINIGGLVITEIIAGIILWKLEINREDLGFFQAGPPLPEVLIYVFAGALVGLLQFPLLRKSYHKAGLWILASIIAWATVPLAAFAFGGVTLGAITGATFIWILQRKEDT